MEIELSGLKENLDREHQKWRAAQTNYERQVREICLLGLHDILLVCLVFEQSDCAILMSLIFMLILGLVLLSLMFINHQLF